MRPRIIRTLSRKPLGIFKKNITKTKTIKQTDIKKNTKKVNDKTKTKKIDIKKREILKNKKIILNKKIPNKKRLVPNSFLVKKYSTKFNLSEKMLNEKLNQVNKIILERDFIKFKEKIEHMNKNNIYSNSELLFEIKKFKEHRDEIAKKRGDNFISTLEAYSTHSLGAIPENMYLAGHKPIEIALCSSIFDAVMEKAGFSKIPGDSILSNRTTINHSFKERTYYNDEIKSFIDWKKVMKSLEENKFKKMDIMDLVFSKPKEKKTNTHLYDD